MKGILLSAALAASLATARAVEDGVLIGTYFNVDTLACDLWSVSPSTGENKTIGTSGVCKDTSTTWPSYSAHYPQSTSLYVALAEAPAVYSVDMNSAATSTLVKVTYNDSNPFIGFISFSPKLTYLVTQYQVWILNSSQPYPLINYAFPADVQLTGTATGGTGNGPRLFIHDGDSDALYTVDINAGTVSKSHTGIKGLLDLQYDSGAQTTGSERLIAVIGYTLGQWDLKAHKFSKIGGIPDGPGYPRVNALSPSGKTLAIIDFANVFTMDTVTGAVGPLFPFSKAPKVVGFPVWVAQ